jgi:Dyp-type peroxidase family
MSGEFTPQSFRAAPVATPGTLTLEIDEIQGDVLIGLQKCCECFVFFEIADVVEFKKELRQRVVQHITTTRDVQTREFQLRDLKNHGQKDPIPNVGLNLAFTSTGLQKLVPNTDFGDPSFHSGAISQAPSLGDPTTDGKLDTWLTEFLSDRIDGVFLVTGGSESTVNSAAKNIVGILGQSITIIRDEGGKVRPGAERGHEHFGWQDGISQPGINGLTDPFPGQQMMDPGLFVFGYPSPSAAPAPVSPPVWAKNGSFMVFRRLRQLVPEFEQFILDQSASEGVDPVLLGARLVGRWKSGAPLALTPSQDDTTLAADPQRNNNFDFSDDQGERRCPFGAHIRKANPRADLAISSREPIGAPSAVSQGDVSPRRIIRQGIPYGEEVTAGEATAGKSTEDRGLMFVCYQSSIVNQFEFLQISWANNSGFIFNKKHPDGSPVEPGIDPIIGQNTPGTVRVGMDEPVPNYPTGNSRSRLNQPNAFVVPTGGGYFFVPSISAMQQEISSPA